jgi:hypothetical protein
MSARLKRTMAVFPEAMARFGFFCRAGNSALFA